MSSAENASARVDETLSAPITRSPAMSGPLSTERIPRPGAALSDAGGSGIMETSGM